LRAGEGGHAFDFAILAEDEVVDRDQRIALLPADLDAHRQLDHAFGIVAEIGHRDDLRLHAANALGIELVDLGAPAQRRPHRLEESGVVGVERRHLGVLAGVDQLDITLRHRAGAAGRRRRGFRHPKIDVRAGKGRVELAAGDDHR
jgi:hypothetical protein